LAGCGGGGGSTSSVSLPPLSAPIPLIEGQQIGDNFFAAPNSNGQTVDNNACDVDHFDYHIHSHLSIFLNGRQLAIPSAIGIKNPRFETSVKYPDGFAIYGDCVYLLHTHDTSGRLHVEAPEVRTFTLGEVFRIWGKPLTRENIAGIVDGPVVIYIKDSNGLRRYDGDPAAIPLASKKEITIQIGSQIPIIPTYQWFGEPDNGVASAADAEHFKLKSSAKK